MDLASPGYSRLSLEKKRTMNNYSIALFFHIVGVLGYFVALGLEWTSLHRLRQATTTAQAREWIRISSGLFRLGGASMALILVAGLYMMAVGKIGAAWLIVAFWAFVVLAVLAAALSGPRMAGIRRAVTAVTAGVAENGPVAPTLSRLVQNPLLWISIQTRVALALSIVFLMTVKPDLGGALLTVSVGAVLGVASALPLPGRARTQEGPAI